MQHVVTASNVAMSTCRSGQCARDEGMETLLSEVTRLKRLTDYLETRNHTLIGQHMLS